MAEPVMQPVPDASRLEMRGIRKAFGATVALDSVDLAVRAGDVCALVGQNGAGKSTLMGILAGAITPDAGAMRLDGAPYAPRDPLIGEAANQGEQPGDVGLRQAACWLVEDQHATADRARPRNFDELLGTGRQIGGEDLRRNV